jgi:hypothetical protein
MELIVMIPHEPMLHRTGNAASLAFAAFVLAAVSGFGARGADDAPPAPGAPPTSHSIVNGMRIQPREGDLERSKRSDVDDAEAKDIEEINRSLLGPDPDQRRMRSIGSGGSDMPRVDTIPAPAKE